jgi:hypothetical protein
LLLFKFFFCFLQIARVWICVTWNSVTHDVCAAPRSANAHKLWTHKLKKNCSVSFIIHKLVSLQCSYYDCNGEPKRLGILHCLCSLFLCVISRALVDSFKSLNREKRWQCWLSYFYLEIFIYIFVVFVGVSGEFRGTYHLV